VYQEKESSMNRRDFLKIGGLVSTALLFQISPAVKAASAGLPAEAMMQGLIYRGTKDGNIYVSRDSGKTWQLQTSFGKQYAVRSFYVDLRNNLVAVMDYLGHTFRLVLSKKDAMWRTM
jgi:uncharacterized protein (DUF1501 family)